jgi:hypothetical protein
VTSRERREEWRQRDVESDGECDASVAGWKQAHRRVDPDLTGIQVTAPSDGGDGTFETRGVPDREQLLRTRGIAVAAHLLV